jgi:hypothetical protein
MKLTRRSVVAAATIIALIIPVIMAQASSADPANEFFQRTWERTDRPVETDQVDRTWMWGPGANTASMWEPYAESPDGTREVQYFDKSRMEINLTGEPEDSLWYMTNGLLVVEMITERIQIGEDSWEPHQAESMNVAGDRDGETGPTYIALAGLLDAVEDRGQDLITQAVDHQGNVSELDDLTDFGVSTAHYDHITGHNVAAPFWEFMTSSGLIYENRAYVQGAMFEHPVYATGRPTTEPYWTWVPVGGDEQWVLLQAFERRVLTYTPGNPEGWQVEAGNVGRHYFEWRYGHPVEHEPPATDDSDSDDATPPGNGGTPPGAGDDSADDGIGNGDDDTGNGDHGVSNGDDSVDDSIDDGIGNGDDSADDDNGNGIQIPDDLGLGIQVNAGALGSQVLDVTVSLNNPTGWEGLVELELICDGDVVDQGVINLGANASANASLGFSGSGVLTLETCTVNALINGQLVDSGTVVIVDLLPNLPLLPDLGIDVDVDANVLNLLSCEGNVSVDIKVTNNNDYVGPVDVHAVGPGINTTQTINLNGPGTYDINLDGQGIDLMNILNAQAYTITASVDGDKVAEGFGTGLGLNICLGLLDYPE